MNEASGLSVRARFERFPATVKGAFILRGEDANPHQVAFRGARAVSVGGRVERPVAVPDATLDVAPHRDVFVPFELGVSELDPGWYDLICDLDVDGILGAFDGGRRFAVPWPRASLRRGRVKVGERVALGEGASVLVEELECGGDSIKLAIAVQPPGPLSVRLSAGGARLEVLDVEIDQTSGRGRVVAYPLMKAHPSLHVELRGRGKDAGGVLEIALP